MMHWLWMGGYWPYVWPSYAITLLIVVVNIYGARRSHREARRDARRRLETLKGDPS